jgi:ribonuclease P protein component
MLSQYSRFHGHGSLRYIYRNGEAIRSQLLTIKYVHNPRRRHARVAVVVSKKVLKKAVGRNRIRRRIYEIFREELPLMKESYDIVCIVSSPEARDMEFTELREHVRGMLSSASIYKDSPENDIINQ